MQASIITTESNLIMDDKAWQYIQRVLNMLLVTNPKGTSIGALLGVVLNGITRVFAPAFKHLKFINLSNVNLLYYIALGTLITNVQKLFTRPKFDENIEGVFLFIRQAKKEGKLSDSEIRQMYRKLFVEVLEKVKLAKNVEGEIASKFDSGEGT